METTTDFDRWLSAIDTHDFNEVYYIYKSVEELGEWGSFSGSIKEQTNKNMYFIKCDYIDYTLILASEKARMFFLKHLEVTYADGLTIEGWYSLKRAMEKND